MTDYFGAGKLAFGHLQTFCPIDPQHLMDEAQHLARINAHIKALASLPQVFYVYPSINVPPHRPSFTRLAGGIVYNIPIYLFLWGDTTFAELPLVDGRFLPIGFMDFINPLAVAVTELYTAYSRETY